ncbi:MAG: hypothetical protein ACJAYU_001537 [Bradymonadia bacterium]|jgi:hypothetical protein
MVAALWRMAFGACSESETPVAESTSGDAGADLRAAASDFGDTENDGSGGEVAVANPGELAAACTPVPFAEAPHDVCAYYFCVDQSLGCDEDEYIIAFACKYANRYVSETYEEMTPDGQRFVIEVFECLQQTLHAAGSGFNCVSAQEVGFASHAPCYVNARFCELILDDKLAVLQAIDPEDLEHPLQIAAQNEIIERCTQ